MSDLFNPVINNGRGSFGPHYTIYAAKGMSALRKIFPDGEADDMNFCLFSTSGIHGTYVVIEEVETNKPGDVDACTEVTFLVVQPRIVCLRYGNCRPETKEDFAFLKKLRASSWVAMQKIGAP